MKARIAGLLGIVVVAGLAVGIFGGVSPFGDRAYASRPTPILGVGAVVNLNLCTFQMTVTTNSKGRRIDSLVVDLLATPAGGGEEVSLFI